MKTKLEKREAKMLEALKAIIAAEEAAVMADKVDCKKTEAGLLLEDAKRLCDILVLYGTTNLVNELIDTLNHFATVEMTEGREADALLYSRNVNALESIVGKLENV